VKDLEIRLTAVDEASATVAQASKRISNSLREVSDSQNGLAAATSQAVAPLTQQEQVQLEAAGSAFQLKTAQQDLSSAQNSLNVAIRGYGTNSVEAAAALRELNAAQANVSTLQGQVGASTKQNTASMRDFTTGISGVATASFSLYSAYDRVNESEISLDRSNLMVKSSTKAVEDAQRALSNAITAHGASSQEATSASDSLSIAQDRLALANERALQAQENVNKSIMSAALQIIPTSITMVDSLSRAWKNFPDLTDSFEHLGSKIKSIGNSVDGLGTKIKGLNNIDLSTIAGSLAAIAAVTVSIKYSVDQTKYEQQVYSAEHNASMPWYETAGRAVKNFFTAIPELTSGYIGDMFGIERPTPEQQAILNKFAKNELSEEQAREALSRLPHLALGGVVDKPTFALIGEAGPEIVMPLAHYEAKRSESTMMSSNSPQEVTVINLTQNIYGDINSEADEDRVAEKAVELLDSRCARRRNM
jgi:hypothetical protein